MRMLISTIVIIYLLGVGVALAPTIAAKWSRPPRSDLASNVTEALPAALAWPARMIANFSVRG